MKIALAGVNHKTAPVELREQLAFRSEEIAGVLDELHARGASEALVLSTCNRVEVTAALDEDADPETLIHALVAGRVIAADGLRQHIYAYEEREAIRHLFRVASGLD